MSADPTGAEVGGAGDHPVGAAPRVLLVGMMASGKTTTGTALAARTGWRYLDNDELVLQATGHTTPDVLVGTGEATLRRVETAALDEALAAPPPVVAGVAGGVILDPEARRRMSEGAFVVYLHAPLDLLARRVGDGTGRPWLGDDPANALARLYAGRDALYRAAADLVLEVEGRSPAELAGAILDALGRGRAMSADPARPQPVTEEQTQLGEGVRWDARRNEVLRVDILAGQVFRDRIVAGGRLELVRRYDLAPVLGPVGAVAPTDGDGWLLAAGRGFAHLRPDGTARPLVDVAPPGTRMNDAACDRQGRFWAGTLADDHRTGGGALYRLDRDGRAEQVLDGLTIANGLGWSPDDATFYLVDSGPGVVHAFDFDSERGRISGGRVLIELDPATGAPDGMTVDAAGDLWIAVYGGARVQRHGPDGVRREVHELPADQTTCCAFAGPERRALYVTTATEGWTDEQRRATPGAGLVYRLETDARGEPAAPYRPRRDASDP